MILFFKFILILVSAAIFYFAAVTIKNLWQAYPAHRPHCSTSTGDAAVLCRATAAANPTLCLSIVDRDLKSHCWFAVRDIQRTSGH